jgi:uncharacterized membrane protein YkoI
MASKFIMKNCSVLLCILVSAALLTIAGKPIGQAVMWYHEVKAQGVNSGNQNMSAAAALATNNGGIANNNNNNSQTITGSIQLRKIIGSAISSQIKVSLIQAVMAAEKAVGSNSHAVAANLGQENGFLTYTVWVADGSYNFHRIVVDAGNGNILTSQNMSIARDMLGAGGSPLISPPSGPIRLP